MTGIEWAVAQVGGPGVAASLCNVTPQAVRKWTGRGRLPRTEYTGETQHCERLANGSNGAFSAAWLLENAATDLGDDLQPSAAGTPMASPERA